MLNSYIYDAQKYAWHSPRYVLLAFDYLVKTYGHHVAINRIFQKAREARATAITLLGVAELEKRHFLMQLYRGQGGSPDIVTMTMQERTEEPVMGLFQEVEVVTLDKHSPEKDVIEFLRRTKFAKNRAYDDKTIILCEIRKPLFLPPYEVLNKQLKQLNPAATVMLIGKVSPTQHVYHICQIWPNVKLNTDIDVVSLSNACPEPHNLMLNYGAERRIVIKKSDVRKPTYHEVFGLNEKVLREMFCLK